MHRLPDTLFSHILFEVCFREVCEVCQKIKTQQKMTSLVLHAAMISSFVLYKKKAIPIQFTTKVPRLGTIGKNHIQSRFNLLKESALFPALNVILSLMIISQAHITKFNLNQPSENFLSSLYPFNSHSTIPLTCMPSYSASSDCSKVRPVSDNYQEFSVMVLIPFP